MPHPHVLFSLVPRNERAVAVVAHPINSDFASTTDGTLALDIGHVRSRSGDSILATLGRGDADIFVEGSSIAKIQCSFEIDLNTNVVMFYDLSHSQTSQVFGDDATPFESIRSRKVVVQERLNSIIGLGGEGRNLVMFELKWYRNAAETMKVVRNWKNITLKANTRFARTVDETDTVLPSRRRTRPHTPAQPKMRYAIVGDILGRGSFGEVYRAVDIDSGKLMAVKVLNRPVCATNRILENWKSCVYYALKREVEILANISHPHIVDYITSQGWDGIQIEIFMGLKEGTLESLIEDESCPPVAEAVFYQMLQALDCLALNTVIHRDVKPENILYTTKPDGRYQFQLGDFGLCNHAISANTAVGTPLYLAPEMDQNGKQTHKADVWSLFVTMLWTLNVADFRQKQFRNRKDVRETILSAALNDGIISNIREMAILDPEERASAAQMLVKCFDGVGLCTPRAHIQATNAKPTSVVAIAPAPSSPAPTTRTTKQKLKFVRKDVDPFAAVAPYRLEKVRNPLRTRPPKRPFRPVIERRPEQAPTPLSAEKHHIPGAFPSENIDAIAKKRYFT